MKGKPHRIVFLYLLISVTWITLSDQVVSALPGLEKLDPTTVQTCKGVLFVCITAILLYLGIRRQQKIIVGFAQQYKSLFDSNPNPLWIYDHSDLSFIEVNKAACTIYGYTEEEFRKMTILDIRPAEDRVKLQSFISNLTHDQNISENWKHLTKSGQILIVNITSHRILFNNRLCSLVMAQDVTHKLRQEEKLQLAIKVERELRKELEQKMELVNQSLESKRRLAEVVDRINNMVIITDPSGVITWVNAAFENFTGFKLNEVIGKTTHFLHGPLTAPDTQETIMETLQGSGFCRVELINYTKAGEEYWVELNISAIYDDKGRIARYISIQNIINERKNREQKIREQNQILRKHSWTNSHAIRKPIASILSLVSLSKEFDEIEPLKEIHSLIGKCAEDLDLTVREVSQELNASEVD